MTRLIASVLAIGLTAFHVSAQPVAEPSDYRNEEYRGPVPVSLEGATVIETHAAYALWKTDRVAFVDVFPQAPRPENLPKGTLFREKPRYSIPGAIWVPNVGYGKIADETAMYFKEGLAKITNDDPTMPVVLFCLEECWMSWNAAKRIQEYGYSNVFWYPDGTDGWEFFDYPLEEVPRFELLD